MAAEWQKIKTDYITGKIGLRKLAEKHGVSASTLTQRAAREKWADRRKSYRNKVTAKMVEKKADREADKLARLKGSADNVDKLMARISKDSQQFNRYLVNFGKDEVIHKKVDTKALKDYLTAMRELYELLSGLYGLGVEQKVGQTGVVVMEPVMEPEMEAEDSPQAPSSDGYAATSLPEPEGGKQ